MNPTTARTTAPHRVAAIDQLLRKQPGIWRGYETATTPSVATGYIGLDQLLPGRGWPIGALTELVPSCEGIGELQLLLPALQHVALTRGRPVVLIGPPHIPYAPAWARAGLPLQRLVWLRPSSEYESLWAAEQVLRTGIAGAVLLWSAATADVAMRRLQLCADEGHALAFVFRDVRALRNASPAAVRLALHPSANALRIEVLKARGGHGGAVLCPLRRAA
jgi:cell division inhibitor SulA/protein ImuA